MKNPTSKSKKKLHHDPKTGKFEAPSALNDSDTAKFLKSLIRSVDCLLPFLEPLSRQTDEQILAVWSDGLRRTLLSYRACAVADLTIGLTPGNEQVLALANEVFQTPIPSRSHC